MGYLLMVFVGLIGLVLGSFLSVLVSRLDKKEGIIAGRSECPNCFHKLAWYDLIPLLSFTFLRGKCRYCSHKISLVYPILEITMAVVIMTYFGVNGFALSVNDYYNIALIILFVSLVFFDYLYLILPDKVIIAIVVISLIYNFFYRSEDLGHLFIFGFLFALGFAIIYLVSRGRAMGLGDVKLAFAIGLILGYPSGLLVIILAIWAGALWGIGLMLLKKATRKTALPFGSFLSVATIIFIIFYNVIENQVNEIKYFF